RRRDDAVGESLLTGAPSHDRRQAALAEPHRDGPETLGRPQLAGPATSGIEDHEALETHARELSFDPLRCGACRGQRELTQAERLDSERMQQGEVLVDDVSCLWRPPRGGARPQLPGALAP